MAKACHLITGSLTFDGLPGEQEGALPEFADPAEGMAEGLYRIK